MIGLDVTMPRSDAAPALALGVESPLTYVITASGLGKAFAGSGRAKTVSALCDVNLQVSAGQHLAVLGPSGSGKTTLLRCLSGHLAPTDGSVKIERRLSMIHQDLRLVRQRSATHNVMDGALGRLSLWGSLIHNPQLEKKRADQLLSRIGLKDRMYWPVSHLSGGEQQRVAIARSLMQDARILMADEPVAALDKDNACQIMELIQGLCREDGLTVVSVMHDWDLAEVYADRLIGLDRGHVVFDSATTSDQVTPPMRQSWRGPIQSVSQLSVQAPGRGDVSSKSAWGTATRFVAIMAIAVVAYGFALTALEVSPRQLEGIGAGLARFLGDLVPTSVKQVTGIPWLKLIEALAQTIGMSLIGTTLGVLISWPLAAVAARNVGPRFFRHVMRFVLNAVRTVPSLIWALMFVAAVGLGSAAGVLALTAYSVGYLTKFFYEAFEAIDPGPPDALVEIGAGRLQKFLFAVWPASMPAVLSACMFMFEYNVRAASVLGIVGAGGIGYWFSLFFAWRNFPAAVACLLMLLVVVIVIDVMSTRVRSRLVEAGA